MDSFAETYQAHNAFTRVDYDQTIGLESHLQHRFAIKNSEELESSSLNSSRWDPSESRPLSSRALVSARSGVTLMSEACRNDLPTLESRNRVATENLAELLKKKTRVVTLATRMDSTQPGPRSLASQDIDAFDIFEVGEDEEILAEQIRKHRKHKMKMNRYVKPKLGGNLTISGSLSALVDGASITPSMFEDDEENEDDENISVKSMVSWRLERYKRGLSMASVHSSRVHTARVDEADEDEDDAVVAITANDMDGLQNQLFPNGSPFQMVEYSLNKPESFFDDEDSSILPSWDGPDGFGVDAELVEQKLDPKRYRTVREAHDDFMKRSATAQHFKLLKSAIETKNLPMDVVSNQLLDMRRNDVEQAAEESFWRQHEREELGPAVLNSLPSIKVSEETATQLSAKHASKGSFFRSLFRLSTKTQNTQEVAKRRDTAVKNTTSNLLLNDDDHLITAAAPMNSTLMSKIASAPPLEHSLIRENVKKSDRNAALKLRSLEATKNPEPVSLMELALRDNDVIVEKSVYTLPSDNVVVPKRKSDSLSSMTPKILKPKSSILLSGLDRLFSKISTTETDTTDPIHLPQIDNRVLKDNMTEAKSLITGSYFGSKLLGNKDKSSPSIKERSPEALEREKTEDIVKSLPLSVILASTPIPDSHIEHARPVSQKSSHVHEKVLSTYRSEQVLINVERELHELSLLDASGYYDDVPPLMDEFVEAEETYENASYATMTSEQPSPTHAPRVLPPLQIQNRESDMSEDTPLQLFLRNSADYSVKELVLGHQESLYEDDSVDDKIYSRPTTAGSINKSTTKVKSSLNMRRDILNFLDTYNSPLKDDFRGYVDMADDGIDPTYKHTHSSRILDNPAIASVRSYATATPIRIEQSRLRLEEQLRRRYVRDPQGDLERQEKIRGYLKSAHAEEFKIMNTYMEELEDF